MSVFDVTLIVGLMLGLQPPGTNVPGSQGAQGAQVSPTEQEVINALILSLHDPDTEVRQFAGMALAEHGTAAVEPLKKAMADKDPVGRAAAAYALGQLGTNAEPAKRL